MGKKILVVDDERSVVEFLERGLTRKGFRVITAFDGWEAKSKILNERPEIIILDLIMPGVDGWEVLRWMRQDMNLRTPTIIVSAKGELESMKRGVVEADTYLVKPINISDALKSINAVSSLEKCGDNPE